MKLLFVAAAVIVSSSAAGQAPAPSVQNNVPLVAEGEPLVHDGCEHIDTWNGTKIWAGDCVNRPPATAKSSSKATVKAKVKQTKSKKRPAPKEARANDNAAPK